MGIEPTSEAWEASILPLNYARSGTTETQNSIGELRVQESGEKQKIDPSALRPTQSVALLSPVPVGSGQVGGPAYARGGELRRAGECSRGRLLFDLRIAQVVAVQVRDGHLALADADRRWFASVACGNHPHGVAGSQV